MAVLGWLWLISPFVVIGIISHDQELRVLVALHHRRCLALGWMGVALMLVGVMLIPGTPGTLMFVFGTPLAGLIVWLRPDDGEDGGDEGPDLPPIDWDEFERSFWTHVRRRGAQPPTPRSPTAA